jgi:Prenyltransferase and squalene oxidase repeat
MTDAEELQALLLKSRNADGGWPSCRGHSWTEPTALALLALQGTELPDKTRALSASWLAHQQAADGGWPPCATVPTSTWVTSLALLALARESEYSGGCPKGIVWLSDHIYPEMTVFQSFLQATLGLSPNQAPGSAPWFPGTAGWVIPTAFSILALSCWSGHIKNVGYERPIRRAQAYLLSRRCSDGGWNHGGSSKRSEAASSYPETTGLGLVALANVSTSGLGPTIQLAKRFVEQPDSTEGLCWLLMGLSAQGVPQNGLPHWKTHSGTTQELALRLITLQTLGGRNPFLLKAI